jgi:hypothetical protein
MSPGRHVAALAHCLRRGKRDLLFVVSRSVAHRRDGHDEPALAQADGPDHPLVTSVRPLDHISCLKITRPHSTSHKP